MTESDLVAFNDIGKEGGLVPVFDPRNTTWGVANLS